MDVSYCGSRAVKQACSELLFLLYKIVINLMPLVHIIAIVILLYGSMGDYLVYCVFVCFVCFLFVCTVTDFSAAKKDNGVKLCMLVRLLLLSAMSISHFDELWLTGSHSGVITSAMSNIQTRNVGQCPT